jgi:hypothetical protein
MLCFSAQFKIYGKRGSLLTFLGWDVSKRLSDGSELSCWALLSPPAIKLRSESKKFIFMTTSEYNGRALIAIAYLPLLKLKCLVHLKFETVGIQNNNCLRLHICSTESIINFFSTSIWWSSKFKRLPSPNQRAEPSFVEEFRALYRRINVRAFLVELTARFVVRALFELIIAWAHAFITEPSSYLNHRISEPYHTTTVISEPYKKKKTHRLLAPEPYYSFQWRKSWHQLWSWLDTLKIPNAWLCMPSPRSIIDSNGFICFRALLA